MSDTSRIEKLEKELQELKVQMGSNKKEKREKKPRELTEYNKFVKDFLAKEKQKPDYDHKKAFKSASEAWKSKK